ncbi:MAG TPA: hypothetical protein VJQ56_07155 [Blastocatellia bacterium]|nr:hypothetical protein [Blastocatellia bacterium]
MKADSKDSRPDDEEKDSLKKAIIIYAIIEAVVLIPLIIYLILR